MRRGAGAGARSGGVAGRGEIGGTQPERVTETGWVHSTCSAKHKGGARLRGEVRRWSETRIEGVARSGDKGGTRRNSRGGILLPSRCRTWGISEVWSRSGAQSKNRGGARSKSSVGARSPSRGEVRSSWVRSSRSWEKKDRGGISEGGPGAQSS